MEPISEELKITPFVEVYNIFFSKITDDMYMELTERETYSMLQPLLLSAIHWFEFPRHDISSYVLDSDQEDTILIIYGGNAWSKYPDIDWDQISTDKVSYFSSRLSQEEINILATYMIVEWLGQQLASIENVRMKYSGSDFKFTSQANHIQKVLQLQKDYERKGFHLQRLYKRRKADEQGVMRSTFGQIMESSFK